MSINPTNPNMPWPDFFSRLGNVNDKIKNYNPNDKLQSVAIKTIQSLAKESIRDSKNQTLFDYGVETSNYKLLKILLSSTEIVDKKEVLEAALNKARQMGEAGQISAVMLEIALGLKDSDRELKDYLRLAQQQLSNAEKGLPLDHQEVVQFVDSDDEDDLVLDGGPLQDLPISVDLEKKHIEIYHTLMNYVFATQPNLGFKGNVYNNLMSPLTIVTRYFPKKLSEIVKAEADVNLPDFTGSTALMVAVQYHPELIEELIKAGANVNLKKNEGDKFELSLFTPLMHAVKRKDVAVVQLLLQHQADVHAKDESGLTPLFVAIDNDVHIEMIRVLVDAGADLNAKDNSGRTILRNAIERGSTREVISFLLSRGARVDKQLIERAKEKYPDIVLLLEQFYNEP